MTTIPNIFFIKLPYFAQLLQLDVVQLLQLEPAVDEEVLIPNNEINFFTLEDSHLVQLMTSL